MIECPKKRKFVKIDWHIWRIKKKMKWEKWVWKEMLKQSEEGESEKEWMFDVNK
jgi:hypothetical protein